MKKILFKIHTSLETKEKNSLCPYCNNSFNRVVKSKSKCKECGNTVYKRTDEEGSSIIVTKEEADEIEKKRLSGNPSLYNIQQLTDRYRSFLDIPKFKKIDPDNLTRIILSQIDKAEKQQHYGHIRNFLLDLSITYEYREENEASLTTLMKALYIDDSGINKNIWMITQPELKKHIDVREGELLDVFKISVLRISQKIGINKESMIRLYSKIARKEESTHPIILINHEKAVQNFKNFIA